MSRHPVAAPDRASTLSYWLLIAFLAILWVAGGASRADVLGQSAVRFSAWTIIAVAILALPRVDWRAVKEPAIILGAAALLVALQLVPLPPAVWSELPGRAIFTEAAVLTGSTQPWRPLSISPSGTANALGSLIVPAVVLLLAANLTREQHWQIAIFVLALVAAGAVLGVLQFSGASFDNPFTNDMPGDVSGNFANRNHFALFLAMGCVLSLAWAFRARAAGWRVAAGFGLLTILVLMILATGSRSGVIVGLFAIVLAFIAFRDRVVQQLKRMPHKLAMPLVAGVVCVMVALVALSIGLDRAASIDRVGMMETDADLRFRIWPVVLNMAQHYFPAGSGFGAFDQVFRISEPDHLLYPRYINLAHNDWAQLTLEGGMLGMILFALILFWFATRSVRAWSSAEAESSSRLFARVGSIIISLVLFASITDYPARTPIVMALLALAAIWLANARSCAPGSRLNHSDIA